MGMVWVNNGIRALCALPLIVIGLVEGHRLRRDGRGLQRPTYGLGGIFYKPPSGWWWDGTAGRFRAPDGTPHPTESPRTERPVATPRTSVVLVLFSLFWIAIVLAVILILVVADRASPILLLGPCMVLVLAGAVSLAVHRARQ